MRWAALLAWLLTAAGGGTLFALWARHGGPRQREGIRMPTLLAHAGLATGGLVLWIAYLASDERWLAWTSVAVLLAVAAIGIAMFALSWRGRTRVERTAVPAEASFPAPVVLGHGILGATTFLLVLLAAAGVG